MTRCSFNTAFSVEFNGKRRVEKKEGKVVQKPGLFSEHAKRQQRSKDKEIAELKKQIEELRKKNGKR